MVLSNKYGEEGEITSQIELPIFLTITEILTQSALNNIDLQWTGENKVQNIEMKKSGWKYQKINSMSIKFYETGILNGSSNVKNPLRFSALVNMKNDLKYCFVRSVLASVHPCNINPIRVSKYRQYFNELNVGGFDFTNGFKCSDKHKFEKLNNVSINIIELNFYQDNNKWKHKLIPIELSKNEKDKVIDVLIYKNHYALNKKLNVFIDKEDNKYTCRKCLSGYTSDNMINKHKQKCDMRHDIATIKTSNTPYTHWDIHCHKNPVYFRISADFEADNEIDSKCNGKKTTDIHKQNPVCSGYRIEPELNDILQRY